MQGEIAKILRLKTGYTIGYVASELGLSRQRVSGIEKQEFLSSTTILKLCDLYDVSPNEFFNI